MQAPSLQEAAAPALDTDHIGIIAGEGKFPFLLAKAARERHIAVTAIGIEGVTSPKLAEHVDTMHWVQFGKFKQLFALCRQSGFAKAVMAGRIKHKSIFQITKMDSLGLKMLGRVTTRKADAILGAITDEFAREKIEIIDSTLLIRECLAPSGVLTPRAQPSRDFLADVEFGRPLADTIAGADIGQTVVVKQQTIVAVEGMGGTDKTIRRAAEDAGEGCIVVKVSKPRQDKRFDVPVIGKTTIRTMIEARCAGLAIPGGEALFFDREEACELAEQNGICIYAW